MFPPPYSQFTSIHSITFLMLFHYKIHETIKRFFLIPVVELETELVHVPLHYFTDTL